MKLELLGSKIGYGIRLPIVALLFYRFYTKYYDANLLSLLLLLYVGIELNYWYITALISKKDK